MGKGMLRASACKGKSDILETPFGAKRPAGPHEGLSGFLLIVLVGEVGVARGVIVARGLFKVLDGRAEPAAELGEFAHAEEDDDYEKDDYEFRRAEAEHKDTSRGKNPRFEG
jgi:hypothetical protein